MSKAAQEKCRSISLNICIFISCCFLKTYLFPILFAQVKEVIGSNGPHNYTRVSIGFRAYVSVQEIVIVLLHKEVI